MTDAATAPALKDIFDARRLRHIARETAAVYPAFDEQAFLTLALKDLGDLSLMQRLRRVSDSLQATLPADYRAALAVLRQLAPRIDHGFVTLVLSDFVGQHGADDFDASMEALKFFTGFGSAEFAVREFIRREPDRTLAVMAGWARDGSEHVRRLASEGTRPRLPWSFRLDALMADPELAAPILDALKADSSLYVRKSVANHLNDITKLHPEWVLAKLATWPLDQPHTAWIARHALRTLIKQGDRRALAVIGAGEPPAARIAGFEVRPARITLGERMAFCFYLVSTARAGTKPQRLVVDYAVHYVKKSGNASPKVFKLKELTLAPGESVALAKSQVVRDFTTRTHHPGRHAIDVMVNGEVLASGHFTLVAQAA
jgi:3-methyladenine DNA glycosylase AlkC